MHTLAFANLQIAVYSKICMYLQIVVHFLRCLILQIVIDSLAGLDNTYNYIYQVLKS